MNKSLDSRLKESVQSWNTASPILDQVRKENIRAIDTVTAMQSFDQAFRAQHAQNVLETTSGLVEQQRIFRTLAA